MRSTTTADRRLEAMSGQRVMALMRTGHASIAVFALGSAVTVTLGFGLAAQSPAREALAGQAAMVFTAGIAYLILVAAAETRLALAWQKGAALKSRMPLLAEFAHLAVLLGVLVVPWRSEESRVLLAGLDYVVAAVGTLCVLSLLAVLVNRAVSRWQFGHQAAEASQFKTARAWALVHVVLAGAFLLTLADLERQPLPSEAEVAGAEQTNTPE